MSRRRAGGFGLSAACAGLLALGATLLAALILPSAAPAAKYFHSPSGNIGCGVSHQGARCDIRQKDWRPPSRPRSCRLDWGYGLTLGKRGKGRFFCGSDSLLGIGSRLAYGKSIRRGRFKCKSREDGMKCFNVRNGHGFFISRERYRRF
jgi:hypothetical protein